MEGELTTKFYQKQKERSSQNENKWDPPNLKRKFQWGKGLKTTCDLSGKFIKSTCDLPSNCTNPDEEQTEVQEFYRGVNVLITGATGFMGKALIEKLLVSCPNIGNLFLVIREKKGKTPEERFDILFQEEVFSRLYKLCPDFRKKLIAVNGDMTQPNLGMTESDYERVTKEVSVIFHGAANVRFDESLKSAVNVNIKGVIEILKLAKNCKSLKSLMHVSTVYSNCIDTNKCVNEEFYPSAIDYKSLLEFTEKATDEVLEKMREVFIKPWPNTYCYTKQIAEDVIRKEGQGLPVGILRPGIIIATYKEPIRGWIDNVYGPTGVIVGAGTGVLRVINADKEAVANVIPVDLVVNETIVSAWKTYQNYSNGNKNIVIYNQVSAARNPIYWGEFSYWNNVYGQNWPTILAIWYIEFHVIKNGFIFALLAFLLHTLPSYVADAMFIMCGKKPKHAWTFTDDNTLQLWNSLSPKDQAIFPFDIADVDWDYHAQAHVLGLRLYVVKDDLETLNLGRKKWKRLKFFHRCLQITILTILSWMMYRFFNLLNHNS